MRLKITKPTGKRLIFLVLSFCASMISGLVWLWYTVWPAVAFLAEITLMIITFGAYRISNSAHNDPAVENLVMAGGIGAVLFAGLFVYLLFQRPDE